MIALKNYIMMKRCNFYALEFIDFIRASEGCMHDFKTIFSYCPRGLKWN